MSGRDFYKILGINRNATQKEIKKAYNKLALKYHPDKVPKDQYTEEMKKKWHDIQDANETLKDPKKREEYDQFGEGGAPPDFGLGGLFTHLFGGGGNPFGGGRRGRGRPRGPQKVKPILQKLLISLEDAFLGATKTIVININKRCPNCNGFACMNPETDLETCRSCNGHGVRTTVQQLGPFMVQQSQSPCNECGTTGKVIKDGKKCKTCVGNGLIKTKKQLKVKIPKGIKDGEAIAFEKQGDDHRDLQIETGDVVIGVVVKEHPIFTRVNSGDDLLVEKEILLHQSLCGFKLSIPFLNGEIFNDYLDYVIDPDHTKVYKLKGMPIRGPNNMPIGYGNLLVKFKIVFPKHLSENTKKQIQNLLISQQ